MQLHVSGQATARNSVKQKKLFSTQQRIIEDPTPGLPYRSHAHLLQGVARNHMVPGCIKGLICFRTSILD